MLQYISEEGRKREAATSAEPTALRVGVTGPPGAGKSTLIEWLGMRALEGGASKVAVLAIDPSSHVGGGSILGDMTRMEKLSTQPGAFIRPSPSKGVGGGLARATDEAAMLCQAAGCRTVFVETVGGGQADVAVSAVSDLVVLVMPPAGGDSLQGIKKGVMECADVVLINKADGPLLPTAEAAASEFQHALHFVQPRFHFWTPQVMLCSAVSGKGMEQVWGEIGRFRELVSAKGVLQECRATQRLQQWRATFESELLLRVWGDPEIQEAHRLSEAAVASGELCARAAVESTVQRVHVRPLE